MTTTLGGLAGSYPSVAVMTEPTRTSSKAEDATPKHRSEDLDGQTPGPVAVVDGDTASAEEDAYLRKAQVGDEPKTFRPPVRRLQQRA